ncbi:Yip1 family protein [Polycladomyces zharkentensis]|uniref:Yip1 family protein n=1 Tax=Polycladomyces zharkentensis TaxID=2807616 RepID=UPI00265E9BBA|nr:Yip1 family protein [Polycladomyces sp. WAk]
MRTIYVKIVRQEVVTLESIRNLWFILFHPRDTVQRWVEEPSSKRLWLLVILAGICMNLDRAANTNAGDKYSLSSIVLGSLILGLILGIIGWLVFSGLTYWAARWYGGHASWKETRLAYAWGTIPYSVKLIFWVPQLLIFGKEMFTEWTPSVNESVLFATLMFIFAVIEIVLTIWSFVFLSQCIAEVNGFSAWKGLASVITIPLILFVLLLFILLL